MNTVFLDVDGVLADFRSAALEAFQAQDTDPHCYDLSKVIGCDPCIFWSHLESVPYFWESIPRYPWAIELVRTLSDANFQIAFASSPSESHVAFTGKARWIHHLVKDVTGSIDIANTAVARRLFITGDKSVLAGANRFLVDDLIFNVSKWLKLGHHAMLFPTPSNQARSFVNNPVEYVVTMAKLYRRISSTQNTLN